MRYFLYDTETGGNTTRCSLLSLSGIMVDEHFSELARINLLIKPSDGVYKIEPIALEINKIDLIEHDKVALTEKEAGVKLLDFLKVYGEPGQKVTVGGWNVYFDNSFVQTYLLPDLNDLICRHLLDVASVAVLLKTMGLLPSDLILKLENLAKWYEVEFSKNAHDAQSDVEATVKVFKCMQSQLTSRNH